MGGFIIQGPGGRYWTELGWVPEMRQARLFAGPGDPWADCQDVCLRLAGLGVLCAVAYVPRRKSITSGRQSHGSTPYSLPGLIRT